METEAPETGTPEAGAPLPRWLDVLGWYGTAAIVFAYFASSHGLLDQGRTYQLLNLTGAIGVGLVCWRKRAWQPLSLEVIWALVAVSALTLGR